MRNLLKAWPHLARRLSGKKLLLMLDYDGTLAPIRAVPGKAALPARTRKLLEHLAARPSVMIAIVSGRDLRYLRKAIGLKNIIYASNHGFRISGRGMKFSVRVRRGPLAAFRRELAAAAAGTRGALVENKEFSAALHYRRARPSDARRLRAVFMRLLARHPGLEAGRGKKVLEAAPVLRWDKGRAVLYIIEKVRAEEGAIVPLYIGDDRTDENAFRALAGRGVAARVGRKKNTRARYYLENTAKVAELLAAVARAAEAT
ncbi:MAG: trehalose-phosphatase [Elusimicrobiales bacterium]